jgi:hypothetical protein
MQAVWSRQIKLGLPYVQWQGEPSRYLVSHLEGEIDKS